MAGDDSQSPTLKSLRAELADPKSAFENASRAPIAARWRFLSFVGARLSGCP
jgi:hypothetical protein